jgi:hypothetical protein
VSHRRRAAAVAPARPGSAADRTDPSPAIKDRPAANAISHYGPNIPAFTGFKRLFHGMPLNSVRDTKCPRFIFSKTRKHISDNAYDNFNFHTVGENSYRRRGLWELCAYIT